MMPCQDVRNLTEEHLAGTLDPKRRRALISHLKTCPACHRAVEEARLAGMVLHQAAELPPPPDLATKIKSAARFRLLNRPRPLHERALGSPAFLATLASLLCGAIICLGAIVRVGSVPVDTPDTRPVAQHVAAHSPMTTAQHARPAAVPAARQRPPLLKDVAHVAPQPVIVGISSKPALSAPRLRPVDSARLARANPAMVVCSATHPSHEMVAMVLLPAVQRTSLPGVVEPVSVPDRVNSPDSAAPAVDRSAISPALSLRTQASEPPGDQR